ncbi:hypothetical protein BZG36_03317 [Bifiguratus adelaidae]|uniref:Uncharacterized protein n=1 Tax=Bifiguratus adelaidae TaxID=1938954 RepID=A0A261XXU5_9FUNG|nr:hypothetical protein BZG36_03317 [Bifiguratus adelaidae]
MDNAPIASEALRLKATVGTELSKVAKQAERDSLQMETKQEWVLATCKESESLLVKANGDLVELRNALAQLEPFKTRGAAP